MASCRDWSFIEPAINQFPLYFFSYLFIWFYSISTVFALESFSFSSGSHSFSTITNRIFVNKFIQFYDLKLFNIECILLTDSTLEFNLISSSQFSYNFSKVLGWFICCSFDFTRFITECEEHMSSFNYMRLVLDKSFYPIAGILF